MPIKIDKQTFPTFEQAVAYIMKKKKFKRAQAAAYVAAIDKKENPKKK